jgi:NAD(P)-dependent dehydrogenase (short-subunit alcohol dehydrogenase family)
MSRPDGSRTVDDGHHAKEEHMAEGRLRGQVIAVTGAGSGIGAAVAKLAAAEGASVLLLGRRVEKLEATAAAIGGGASTAVIQQCDVTDASDIDRAVVRALDEWGRVDGLVNNAGSFQMAHALVMTRQQWDETIAVDLTAAFFMSQAFGRVMAKAGKGSIVNMASVDGHAGEPLNAPYNSSKAGLIGLSRSLALDLTPFGIRCNSVSPGYVDGTPMADDTADTEQSVSELLRNWQRVPLRRMVDVDEVAQMTVFLLSDAASGLTGSDLVVDGGLLSNIYALDSVEATGWVAFQNDTLEQVRQQLEDDTAAPSRMEAS